MSSLPAICLAAFAFSLAGGLIPILSIEAFLIAVAGTLGQADACLVAVAASLGQMAGKSLVYLAGGGLLRLPLRGGDRMRNAAARVSRARHGPVALTFVSAVTSVPPFYAVSLGAGALRLRFASFFAAGWSGAFLRFALLLGLARLVTA